MKKYFSYFAFLLLLFLTGAIAQTESSGEGNRTFTQQELDQMMAPIALYPDPLLSQVLMAATYPLEVIEAARWSNANPGLKGDAAVQAVGNQNWDASVKSLVAFPQVLQTMDQKIDWTERLGDAFLAQQPQVMDTVQHLRQKAQAAGNLRSNAQIAVGQSDDSIEVEPVNPDVMYVPYYNPAVVYGSWWWPDYPPVFGSPWAGYGWNSGFAWGIGIGIGANFFFGGWDWRNHHAYVRDHEHPGVGHAWQHDPTHRRGVPYRNASLNRQFGRAAASASRTEFRGHVSSLNTSGVNTVRATNSTNIRQAEIVNRLPATSVARARQPEETRQPTVRETRTIAPQKIESQNVSRPAPEPRAHAFENIDRGADVRSFSARGNASLSNRASAPRSTGGSSGGAGRSSRH